MKWTTICFSIFFSVITIQGLDDPYKVLGVSRSAGILEIRKAYKQLAKEWHPDKNSDPEAESKFVAVNQAYELLSDPERRKQFDMFGVIDDTPRPSKQPNFDTFDDIFTSSGFRFHFADRDITLFHKLSITTRAYENMLVPKSYRTPYLLLFYSDWCFACLQVEPVWRRIMEEVEPIGVGIATVHAENEKSLTKKVGAHSLPCLALLIDGSTYLYKESLFSVQKVVEFVRSKMPKLVTWVNEENAEKFLSGWSDNKVRALVFQRSQPLRLRYLLAAFFHRERISFGFVVGNPTLRSRYGLRGEQDALLLFNELTERPVASLSMSDIPVQTMHDVIYNNYYLILPRLSSQGLLDALCPVGVRRRLCVVLVCQDTTAHDPHRQAMRRFAAESSYSKERVRFMYIFEERQPQFISALSEGGKETEGVQVAILARRDTSHIKYEWLSDPSDQKDEGSSVWLSYNTTKHFLETSIDKLLHASQALSKEACVSELVDEASQGTVSRLLSKLLLSLEYLQENLAKEHVLTALSVIVSVAVILLAAYFMHYLMKLEEAKVEEEMKKKANGMGSNGMQPQLKIHELRAETYNALCRLLKPGCRSIILLVDNESKTQLLPKFYRVVWPYRRNKTLMFAILNLDKKGVQWYTEVLAQSLPEPRKLTINPRNCIGTVLSLNGLRKYFCMYHAKHPEGSLRPLSRIRKVASKQSVGVGSFMGFSDSTSESDLSDPDIESGNSRQNLVTDKAGQEVLYMEHLLDGLPNWLDRLFEGTTQRYHLSYWPDFPIKT